MQYPTDDSYLLLLAVDDLCRSYLRYSVVVQGGIQGILHRADIDPYVHPLVAISLGVVVPHRQRVGILREGDDVPSEVASRRPDPIFRSCQEELCPVGLNVFD